MNEPPMKFWVAIEMILMLVIGVISWAMIAKGENVWFHVGVGMIILRRMVEIGDKIRSES